MGGDHSLSLTFPPEPVPEVEDSRLPPPNAREQPRISVRPINTSRFIMIFLLKNRYRDEKS
jgi:hypothetical protein